MNQVNQVNQAVQMNQANQMNQVIPMRPVEDHLADILRTVRVLAPSNWIWTRRWAPRWPRT
nr:hypothetical protein GCM10020093_063800 [Planobispora longispora]